MANLYRVVYSTKAHQDASAFVQATTTDNAWSAVKTNDDRAKQLVSVTQDGNSNIYVGS